MLKQNFLHGWANRNEKKKTISKFGEKEKERIWLQGKHFS